MSYDDIKSVLMSYDCVENHKLRPRPPKISDYAVQSIVQSATVVPRYLVQLWAGEDSVEAAGKQLLLISLFLNYSDLVTIKKQPLYEIFLNVSFLPIINFRNFFNYFA
jgi:hypothetical protein